MTENDAFPPTHGNSARARAAGAARQTWTVVGTLLALLVLGTLAAGCRRDESKPASARKARAGPWFEEVAAALNVDFTHTSGETGQYLFPETVTSGACLFDYDDDGFLDLYVIQGKSLVPSSKPTPGNVLFRNRGDPSSPGFEDVTAVAGVADTGYGMGCTCADYDNDGDVDLYVTNYGPNVLYRNNGDGTFSDVTVEAGVGDPAWGSSCAFADYDGDGKLDLFVVNYIDWSLDRETVCLSPSNARTHCPPSAYRAPARDSLYHNNGNGTFTEVTTRAGIDKVRGNGLGVACGDFNQDGLMDFYVANDGMPNRLWVNMGKGRFEDKALLAGCALNMSGVAEAGMGVAAIDVEPDGDLDLFMSHIRNETNTFYLNHGGWFEDTTSTMGLGAPSLGFTGFGLGFADFDHDGRLDLYIANGGVALGGPDRGSEDPYAEPNLLFRGLADNRFEEVLPRGGTAGPLVKTSRGAALGDLDNDGDIDVVVVNKDARLHILRNVIGARGNWIMFRVLNRHGSDAFGALIRIDVGAASHRRIVFPNYGYCSCNDPRVHCGLGRASTVDLVNVRWPNGVEEKFGPFTAGRVYELREGTGR